MLKDLLNKRKYFTISSMPLEEISKEEEKPNIPTGMWSKCENCGTIIYTEDLNSNLKVCQNCGYHFRIGAVERVEYVFDTDTFKEFDIDLVGKNPLDFKGYNEKLIGIRIKTELKEAVVTGEGLINNIKTVACIMDSNFMMGSMGTAVGEKITRAIEYATANKLPLIIFTTSGGARMQEGIFSLMQMAKISGAIYRHGEANLLYITVITDPTTGGVTASFAMEGDIIISEPKALIGFAGRRVIEKTINENLPDGFQTAEFLLEKGFIDKIVDRREMKKTLYKILQLHEVR
ncbi:acetyl-CoA carboxylase carboxyl transferase subunit beta [Clostridium cavendishii DSM 21758]|uniref:Acetyl-coenzyme A carboxylase carboxyl transferase subunit beta n=1 Tax=Clostridium cavendishii DSM 21758 TaxID=1121302 RepID=A0A1M6KGW7_9CLOT|nr:acetyl-CoA carboxylase, carboxyltransferase subunit beta [Clostridium cavendishii]SHJ58185.1 acetyl-CoA carboxylase carboxyl transferase subunit beta [Clostridium cavendishii DSM 21758]